MSPTRGRAAVTPAPPPDRRGGGSSGDRPRLSSLGAPRIDGKVDGYSLARGEKRPHTGRDRLQARLGGRRDDLTRGGLRERHREALEIVAHSRQRSLGQQLD